MNVPGDLIENCQEGVDRHKTNTGLDQSPRKETALPKTIHPISISNGLGFFGQVKRIASLSTGHQTPCGFEVAVEKLRVFGGFKITDGAVHQIPETATTLHPHFADGPGGAADRGP